VVGLFSVANIMFVVVKERTSIIGVKKALGAKRRVILLEILTEAIILCLVGGAMGILLVMGVLKMISSFTDFPIGLTMFNMIFGVVISIITGILAGLLPAINASKLDPVVAIRG
jgi:putative ABC transport system permease protein